ncbi:alpha/beta fold hydrolase [Algimonas porphyrae]|uniref:AB hydrolase-1 domain-containing protein n=1 Tax=Algimonas porphyrae TaxID=1128113 RepID=A0ABQ5V015_9PROT|nr:alpha/beta hydrolase [Algimonas porphyrae]GLQ19582.1 hypothetical protein GCM10007854_05370 [Algimonas porphyrae]
MRSYFGPSGAQIHARIHGTGQPCLFLPPAPHSGAYFEALIPHLHDLKMIAVDYPGYGGSDRQGEPAIEAYAAAIAPHVPNDAVLVGFHTGNLVAAEIARRSDVSGIVMIDIPWFDAQTRAAYARKLPGTRLPTPVRGSYVKAVDGRHESVSELRAFHLWVETLRSGAHQSDAFRAAFAYDPHAGLANLPCPVRIIATRSGLLEPSRAAASAIDVSLTERMDVSAPVFEAHAREMAAAIGEAVQMICSGTE